MEPQLPSLFLLLILSQDNNQSLAFQSRFFNEEDIIKSVTDIDQRLARGQRSILDASSLIKEERNALRLLAKKYFIPSYVLLLNSSSDTYSEEHNFYRTLTNEGFRNIIVFDEGANQALVINENPNDLRAMPGPFDIIGDIHGCYDEFVELLVKLDYLIDGSIADINNLKISHPENRKIIFVGDLVDKGPNTPDVLRLAMKIIGQGAAYCVLGNHEHKLLKKLKHNKGNLKHGLKESLSQLENETPAFISQVISFLDDLPHHLVLDNNKLVVAHAGIKEKMVLRDAGEVKAFCMYGETTGKLDQDGLPERLNWALNYSGNAKVVHGHVPKLKAEWQNNVLDIDTGCVYGGSLTCLRYPSMDLVSVKAHEQYSNPKNGRNPFKDYVNSRA